MSIYEYDMEKHMKQEREEAFEAGRLEGHETGKLEAQLQIIQVLKKSGMSDDKIAEIVGIDKIVDFDNGVL